MSAIRSGTEATKACTGPCGRVLPLTSEWFHVDGTRRGGGLRFKSRCRECTLEANRGFRLRALEMGPPPAPERVTKLAAKPLGERVSAAVALRARVSGEDTKVIWARLDVARGVSDGATERRVYSWRYETRWVKVTDAYEVLDALDLQLVDAYPKQYLKRKLPKVGWD